MKARVYVSFKNTVLDPQGQTIRSALNGLGHKSIAAVRQGKFFDVEIAAGWEACMTSTPVRTSPVVYVVRPPKTAQHSISVASVLMTGAEAVGE